MALDLLDQVVGYVTGTKPSSDPESQVDAAATASTALKGQNYAAQTGALRPQPSAEPAKPSGPLTDEQVAKAVTWNQAKSKLPAETVPMVRQHFGLAAEGGWDTAFVQAIATFQKDAKLSPVDGMAGNGTVKALKTPIPALRLAAPSGALEKKVSTAYADWQKRVDATKLGDQKRSADQVKALVAPILARIKDRDAVLEKVAQGADLPKELVAAIWMREDNSMRTSVYLHNGDPLGKKVVNEPKDTPLFGKDQFVEAAIHALNGKKATQTQLNLSYGSNDLAAMATYAERYNGFGYRSNGLVSAYVAAGTNQYGGGLYTGDGKLSKTHWDGRVGVLAVIMGMRSEAQAADKQAADAGP